jgi:hypothetical protein
MLWGLPEICRRVEVEGTFRLSKAELFLMCEDGEGMAAVFTREVSEVLRAELGNAGLQIFEALESTEVTQQHSRCGKVPLSMRLPVYFQEIYDGLSTNYFCRPQGGGLTRNRELRIFEKWTDHLRLFIFLKK